MNKRTFTVTVEVELDDGAPRNCPGQDHSEGSLYDLLNGLLEFSDGVRVTQVEEQPPIP